MVYTAAFPRQKKAAWHKAVRGSARRQDFRGEEPALQPTASGAAGPARRRAVPRASGTRPEEEPSRPPLHSFSAAEGAPSAAEPGAADGGEPAPQQVPRRSRPWGDRAPRSFRPGHRHRARRNTGLLATAPLPPPEPRTLRGSPRRDDRARALRPHCVAGAVWPGARGAPRAGSGAARAGRGGGRVERLLIAREAPPAWGVFCRGSSACVLRRAEGQGLRAEPVQGAADACGEGRKEL